MIFNLVRTAFHFGTPLQVRESIAISSNVLKQPVDRWLCYPYEDVFPWDFNASFFNYRGYFDKINEWLSTKCKKTKYLVNFIYASMHYYLSFYENDFEHAELAVKFDPNFDSYKYRLSQIILNKKDENNYGLAKKMFSELSNDSILFSEATALLYQFERDIEKNENVINWDKTYSEKFLTAQKNIHELKIPIRATDWKKTILRKKDDSDNSKGVSKKNIKIDGILTKNRHNNLRNIAILMPTLNRPEFLKRSLHYYAQMRFEGTIVVGDSSNELNRTINSETIDHQKNNLNILYGYFPDPPYLHDGMCMREMVNMTKTPYVVYSGDDDFLIPQGLSRCIQALEKENKLTAAFGTRINLKLDRAGAWGKPAAAQLCIGPDFMEDLPSQRLCKYLQNGLSTQYFVHRIDVWKKMYEHVVDVPSRYLGPEVLPCCFSAMQGKIKRLDTPTIVFQNNPNQVFSWDKTSLFDLINDDKWPPSIATILNTVSDQLVLNEKMDSEVARGFVKKELWAHVSGILLMQYKKRFMMGTPCDNIDMKSLKTIMADESMRKVLNPVIQVLIGNNGCKH